MSLFNKLQTREIKNNFNKRDYCYRTLRWSPRSYAAMSFMKGHFGCVNALCISPLTGNFLASGGDDNRILIWNVHAETNRKYEQEFKGHSANIYSTLFLHDEHKIISCGLDQQVMLYDLGAGYNFAEQKFNGHTGPVHRLSLVTGAPFIFMSASEDMTIRLWDIRTPKTQTGGRFRSPLTYIHCSPSLNNPYNFVVSGTKLTLHDLRKMHNLPSSLSQPDTKLSKTNSKWQSSNNTLLQLNSFSSVLRTNHVEDCKRSNGNNNSYGEIKELPQILTYETDVHQADIKKSYAKKTKTTYAWGC